MKSTLEKLVVKKVADTKQAEADKAAEEARKKAAFQAKLPKTREERAKIVWPSITDGDDWKIYFDAGHWRIQFQVGGMTFELHDQWIPAYAGSADDGYAYASDAHNETYLFVKNPYRGVMDSLGSVGDLDDSWLASRNQKDKDSKWRKAEMAKLIKALNDTLARKVEEALLHKDDYRYWDRR